RVAVLAPAAETKPPPHRRPRRDARDALSTYLYSLFGMGTPGLHGRLAVDDRALLFYAGLPAPRPRSATGLVALLGDYFHRLPVRVEQFVGQWLALGPHGPTSLRLYERHHTLWRAA